MSYSLLLELFQLFISPHLNDHSWFEDSNFGFDEKTLCLANQDFAFLCACALCACVLIQIYWIYAIERKKTMLTFYKLNIPLDMEMEMHVYVCGDELMRRMASLPRNRIWLQCRKWSAILLLYMFGIIYDVICIIAYNWIYFPIKIEMKTNFKEMNVDSSWSQVQREWYWYGSNCCDTKKTISLETNSTIFCSFNLSPILFIPSVWQISSFFSFLFVLFLK